ncbi:hypothetical protein B566_EDAN008447 [Ephemera danica]|nr:hypothetical protein B566_EDAN008447 [Ephemera danica]
MRCSNNGAGLGGPICGSNEHTYASWCHMLHDACATGYVIETKHIAIRRCRTRYPSSKTRRGICETSCCCWLAPLRRDAAARHTRDFCLFIL